jgi:hypothetical protein
MGGWKVEEASWAFCPFFRGFGGGVLGLFHARLLVWLGGSDVLSDGETNLGDLGGEKSANAVSARNDGLAPDG